MRMDQRISRVSRESVARSALKGAGILARRIPGTGEGKDEAVSHCIQREDAGARDSHARASFTAFPCFLLLCSMTSISFFSSRAAELPEDDDDDEDEDEDEGMSGDMSKGRGLAGEIGRAIYQH